MMKIFLMLLFCFQNLLVNGQNFTGQLNRTVLELWGYSIKSVTIDLSNRGIVYIDPNTFKVKYTIHLFILFINIKQISLQLKGNKRFGEFKFS